MNILLSEIIPLTFLQPPDKRTILNILGCISLSTKREPQVNSAMIEDFVNREFTRFFRVNGEETLLPYESCWVLKKREDEQYLAPRLYSKTTDEIEEVYSKLGISANGYFGEPPDHLSFELSAFFSLKENFDDRFKTIKEQFITEHFNKWVPSLLQNLMKKHGIFYPHVAEYLMKNL